ncbi:MAG: hypothetical protein J2O48_06465 [Solirubrobacterales bacterium]|nr:hypothetical protein [Solirubrobacterales bacterium]
MSELRVRFGAAVILAVAGSTAALGALTLAPAAERWLAFGAGAGALITVAAAFAVRGRGRLQRSLDLPAAMTGAWTLVAALAFGGRTATWLDFADAAGIAAFGAAAVLLHELGLEHELHLLRARVEPVDEITARRTADSTTQPRTFRMVR